MRGNRESIRLVGQFDMYAESAELAWRDPNAVKIFGAGVASFFLHAGTGVFEECDVFALAEGVERCVCVDARVGVLAPEARAVCVVCVCVFVFHAFITSEAVAASIIGE